tara:strand:- start:143 stop:988 length:846 start_codon:yes stop_codon:yes gene_type:complete
MKISKKNLRKLIIENILAPAPEYKGAPIYRSGFYSGDFSKKPTEKDALKAFLKSDPANKTYRPQKDNDCIIPSPNNSQKYFNIKMLNLNNNLNSIGKKEKGEQGKSDYFKFKITGKFSIVKAKTLATVGYEDDYVYVHEKGLKDFEKFKTEFERLKGKQKSQTKKKSIPTGKGWKGFVNRSANKKEAQKLADQWNKLARDDNSYKGFQEWYKTARTTGNTGTSIGIGKQHGKNVHLSTKEILSIFSDIEGNNQKIRKKMLVGKGTQLNMVIPGVESGYYED